MKEDDSLLKFTCRFKVWSEITYIFLFEVVVGPTRLQCICYCMWLNLLYWYKTK